MLVLGAFQDQYDHRKRRSHHEDHICRKISVRLRTNHEHIFTKGSQYGQGPEIFRSFDNRHSQRRKILLSMIGNVRSCIVLLKPEVVVVFVRNERL